VDLTNVGINGRDALDRRAEVLDGIGSGSRDAAIGFVYADESDGDFVVAGGISEDELSPGLHCLRALDTDSSVLRLIIGAVILKDKRGVHLFDDGAFFGVIGGDGNFYSDGLLVRGGGIRAL